MTTRHIRAFSVEEFSAVHQALCEIRTAKKVDMLSDEQVAEKFRQRIREIIGQDTSKPCTQ